MLENLNIVLKYIFRQIFQMLTYLVEILRYVKRFLDTRQRTLRTAESNTSENDMMFTPYTTGPPECQTFWWGQAYLVTKSVPQASPIRISNKPKYSND